MRRPIKMNHIVKNIIVISILELIPTGIGVAFYFVNNNFNILEVVYALFGVLLFLFACVRNWNRDSKNFKENKTIVEDNPNTNQDETVLQFGVTDLVIGAYDENGDWYSFNFEIEDEDRQLNSEDNSIAITLEPCEDYINSRLHSRYDIDVLMDRITNSIYYILNTDE